MATDITRWFTKRIPNDWFVKGPDITVDRDEILVTGELPGAEVEAGASEDDASLAAALEINKFRERTRDERMVIAEEAQALFQRTVSWGAGSADRRVLFTHLGVPVMSRLRLPEREALDTLVAAGVARNRSDALAWCVRFVRKDQSDWLADLRGAFTAVEEARSKGPDV